MTWTAHEPTHDCPFTLRWRHNGRNSVSNHQPYDHLLNCLWKKTPELRVTGLCAGKSPETGEFPAQMANYAENGSIWWRHHDATWNLPWPVSFKVSLVMSDFKSVNSRHYHTLFKMADEISSGVLELRGSTMWYQNWNSRKPKPWHKFWQFWIRQSLRAYLFHPCLWW